MPLTEEQKYTINEVLKSEKETPKSEEMVPQLSRKEYKIEIERLKEEIEELGKKKECINRDTTEKIGDVSFEMIKQDYKSDLRESITKCLDEISFMDKKIDETMKKDDKTVEIEEIR